MNDPVPLYVARDPVELEEAEQLLVEAGIVYSLFLPTSSFGDVGFGAVDPAPAVLYVDRADLDHARAVLVEAWGSIPELPKE